VVLWELLTEKPLFEGTVVSHILAAALNKEPNYNSSTPASAACIAKTA